ncbi:MULTISPECIES: restriction endonuclease subunit S [Thalassolituus]|uniref:restriction endonuclease subunit S n=1 Tax=Thalassolituus TaxID=187492 RepID=UPI000C689DA2|nr:MULTISPECIES: restriction endonuclease subunit S [Thalassolituus]MAX85901.1 type I restriction endonuclease subunit S [Oceanospirillaceae bacterium]|tara:strand:+ start:1285 stop:2487 length:1203 start_codon:yes stop_codon:yes gene_type:complete
MVPEGWTKAAIKEFGHVSAGRQRSPNFTEGVVRPYLRVANVYEAFIDTSDINEMPFTDIEFERYKLEPGDILLNEGQSTELVGRPAMYQGEPANCCFQNTLVRFKAGDRVNANYALQRFLQCLYDGTFQSISKKTTSIAHLGVSRFADLKLAWPPLPEQKKIAQILSTWDKVITTTEQLLANSQQQKKALMQQLLTGKKRLLDDNGVRFGEEWKWLKASELFKTVSTKNNSDTEELLAVTQDQGVLPRSLLERRVVMPDGSTKGYKLVVPGNFIISLRSFQGGLEYSNYRGLVSPAYTVLEPIKEIDDEFFKHYYKSYDFIGHLAVAVIGIRDGKQISYSDFSFLRIPYPSLEEQQKIATVLSCADQEITALQQKLDAFKQEKKALMQQLLTGKRRVQIN